jgi:hypothetical protein
VESWRLMFGGKLMVNVGERGGGDFGGQTNGLECL